jgi:hypothetical protein
MLAAMGSDRLHWRIIDAFNTGAHRMRTGAPHLTRRSMVMLLTLILAGCASVGFDHGSTRLTERSLVFGKILLDRDGEPETLSVMGTPILFRKPDSADDPRMLSQSFEKDGSFYWTLPPGHWQVNFVLNPTVGGIRSLTFTVPATGHAYYLGDVTFAGRKQFINIGSANIRDIETRVVDRLDGARDDLLRRNPQLQDTPVERLPVRDTASPKSRAAAFAEMLAASPVCCTELSRIRFEPLPAGSSQTAQIGPQTPVFDFPTGRSRLLAWTLPAGQGDYTLQVRSRVTPSAMPGVGRIYVFSPALTLLDADFKVLATHERGLFTATPVTLLPPREASLMAELPVAGPTATARYLVIHTTPYLLEHEWLTGMPGFLPIPGGAIPTGQSRPLILEPAISGTIEVSIKAP